MDATTPQPTPARAYRLLGALFVTLVVWSVFSWPLPRHMLHAIPFESTHRTSDAHIAPMVPGDHLQLLYNFWLFADMLSGHTPWFHNLYEFNTGTDDARFQPEPYYLPLTLVYALGQWTVGQAFGWNLAALVSLWLTCWFTWSLLRRFTADDTLAALFSAVAIAWPYRWISMTGGSPSGLAMAWVPLLLLGLDQAVRDGRVSGAWMAALAVIFAYCSDTHVFFFSVLLIPVWCLIAFSQRPAFAWGAWRAYARLAATLAPVVVAVLGCALATHIMMQHATGRFGSGAVPGRSLHEIRLSSVRFSGLLDPAATGPSVQIFVGLAVPAILALGLLAIAPLFRRAPRRQARRLLLYLLLLAALAGVVTLALALYGPFDGRLFHLVRKLIPPYAMIRQPAKIFCVLPTLFAVTAAVAAVALADIASRRISRLALAALSVWALIAFYGQIQPRITTLDNSQEAYAAVAADAAATGEPPRALVLPLWPGDSHFASVYEHNVSLYRIRMLNGYRPFVPPDYVQDVFKRFESGNSGDFSDAQLDNLLSRGVRCIILHEDLFPEKVSPFPVGLVLEKLLAHPRLDLLRQDRSAWAFRIRATPAAPNTAGRLADCSARFPTRRFEAEGVKFLNGAAREDLSASAGRYLELAGPDARFSVPAIVTPCVRDAQFLIRARGAATLDCTVTRPNAASAVIPLAIATTNWTWYPLPCGSLTEPGGLGLAVALREGRADLDLGLLTAGAWPDLPPGESLRIEAACFFHAGYTDRARGGVVLDPASCRRGVVLYGPNLPMPPGRYAAEVRVETDAPAGTRLGTWSVACPQGREVARFDLGAGHPCAGAFTLPDNLPMLLVLDFSGNGAVTVLDVTLSRLPNDARPIP